MFVGLALSRRVVWRLLITIRCLVRRLLCIRILRSLVIVPCWLLWRIHIYSHGLEQTAVDLVQLG